MSPIPKEDKQILPRLFARVSHDSKRNFRQIKSIFDLLCMDAKFDDSQMELINMISEIAKKGELEFEGLDRFANQIDISESKCELTFSEVLSRVGQESGQVRIAAAENLDFKMLINPHALKSILQEVLSNAEKFSPESVAPSLTVTSSIDSVGIRTVKFSSPSIGVGSYGLHNLWLPYARDSNVAEIEGHGVGLTIVAYLVSQAGGDIALDFNEEDGFILLWRLAENAQSELNQAA